MTRVSSRLLAAAEEAAAEDATSEDTASEDAEADELASDEAEASELPEDEAALLVEADVFEAHAASAKAMMPANRTINTFFFTIPSNNRLTGSPILILDCYRVH